MNGTQDEPAFEPRDVRSALALIALAGKLSQDSRSLADWERKDADEFLWRQLDGAPVPVKESPEL
jgi:hypothetical protein